MPPLSRPARKPSQGARLPPSRAIDSLKRTRAGAAEDAHQEPEQQEQERRPLRSKNAAKASSKAGHSSRTGVKRKAQVTNNSSTLKKRKTQTASSSPRSHARSNDPADEALEDQAGETRETTIPYTRGSARQDDVDENAGSCEVEVTDQPNDETSTSPNARAARPKARSAVRQAPAAPLDGFEISDDERHDDGTSYDYDDLWAGAAGVQTADLSLEYASKIQCHEMQLYKKTLYQIIPRCIDQLKELRRAIKGRKIGKERTMLNRRLQINQCVQQAMNDDDDDDNQSRVDVFYLSLSELTEKVVSLGKRKAWRHRDEVVIDFYATTYPSLALLLFMSILVFSPVYDTSNKESADACRLVELISRFTTAIADFELQICDFVLKSKKPEKDSEDEKNGRTTKVETVINRVFDILAGPLKLVEERFRRECDRRKTAMADLESRQKRERRLQAAKQLETDGQRPAQNPYRRKGEARSDHDVNGVQHLDQTAPNRSGKREKTAAINKARQQLWQEFTEILESKPPGWPLAAKIGCCADLELARSCRMEYAEVEREVCWVVQEHKAHIEKQGYYLDTWPWLEALVQEMGI